jgi:GH25 family lysozyme M1 (1,4-beta-N-acetylmuramidase)
VSRTLTAVRRSARSLVVLVTATSAVTASALAYADGIDISHHQGTVSWSKVSSAGVTFAFMKATEGSTYADPTLRTNWAGAEKQGIFRSAYHFARPSTGSAVAQARYFVSKAGSFSDKGDLPPVLDLEASGGLGRTSLTRWVSDWLTTVERLTGRTPIIYVSPGFWEGYLGNSTAFHHYPLWVAHYGVSRPRVPGGWPTWTFWQRTSTGRVSGIAGNVDMNKFNGSSAQLAKLANTSDSSTGPVQPGPTVPAVAPTTLTLTPAKRTPAIEETVRFSGTLRTKSPVAVVARKTVSVWRRALGSSTWVKVGEDATGRRGRYFVSAKVVSTGDYQARFALTKTHGSSLSKVVRVTTPPRATVSLGLRKRAGTVARGSALKIYGHLKAGSLGLSDQVVRYYKRSPGSPRWIYVGSTTTLAPTGRHALVVHPKISRVWKVEFAGDNHYAPRTSSNLSVRVVRP